MVGMWKHYRFQAISWVIWLERAEMCHQFTYFLWYEQTGSTCPSRIKLNREDQQPTSGLNSAPISSCASAARTRPQMSLMQMNTRRCSFQSQSLGIFLIHKIPTITVVIMFIPEPNMATQLNQKKNFTPYHQRVLGTHKMYSWICFTKIAQRKKEVRETSKTRSPKKSQTKNWYDHMVFPKD